MGLVQQEQPSAFQIIIILYYNQQTTSDPGLIVSLIHKCVSPLNVAHLVQLSLSGSRQLVLSHFTLHNEH